MHPDLGSSPKEKWDEVLSTDGELVEAQNGQLAWIGQSRTNPRNKQFVVFGSESDSDVLVRFDFVDKNPHVNIQVGRDRKGKHTSVKPGDSVVVEIKDGKIRVLVNGEVKDELPVPKGAKDGTVEVKEDGTIQVKDKDGHTIAVHQPEKTPNAPGSKEADADGAKSEMAENEPRNEPLINVPATEPVITVPSPPSAEPLINVPAEPAPQILINVPHPPNLIMGTWRLGQGATWKPHPTISTALRGDWEQLLKRLDAVTHERGDAIQRHLKAHACLATNRNNESFRLFASATDDDLAAWRDWTAGLAATSPKNSYAQFFHADALARLGKNAEAIAAFDKAVERDEKNAIAVHARGVLYAQMGRFNEAVKDIAAAQGLAPDIADVHNSRGMLAIAQREGSLTRVEKHFTRATSLEPRHALALHGLGCMAQLGAKAENAKANNYLKKARMSLPDAAALFGVNEAAFRIFQDRRLASAIARAENDDEAAMGIDRSLQLGQLGKRYRYATEQLAKPDLTKAEAEYHYSQQYALAQSIDKIDSSMTPQQRVEFRDQNARIVPDIRNALQTASRINDPVDPITDLARKPEGRRLIDAFSHDMRNFEAPVLPRTANAILDGAATRLDGTIAAGRDYSRRRLERAISIDTYNTNQHSKVGVYDPLRDGPGVNTPRDAYELTIRKFESTPAVQSRDAGATMDEKHIGIGDEPWPYRPIYSVLYRSAVPATPSHVDAATEADGDADQGEE